MGGPDAGRSQVVVVTHPKSCRECSRYVASFHDVAGRLREEKGMAATVVPEGGACDVADSAEVKVLADDGRLASRLGAAGEPGVAVCDRFGEVFAVFRPGATHQFPDHERVLRVLLDIAIRCPECGVPDVPGMDALDPDAVMRLGGG